MRKRKANVRTVKLKPVQGPKREHPVKPDRVAIAEDGFPAFLAGLTERQRQAVIAGEVAASEAHVPKDPNDAALFAEALGRLRESRARRGRPRVGMGAAKFNVTMERSLLLRVDAYAKENHMTRAAVLARGVERLLAG